MSTLLGNDNDALAGAAGILLALRAADRHEAFLRKHEKRVLLGFYKSIHQVACRRCSLRWVI